MRASRSSAKQLTDGVPDDATARSDDQRARWLLAQLLSWHRREAKVTFWEFFNRLGIDSPSSRADKEALGPLEVVGPVGEPFKPTPRAKFFRQRWRYHFAPQDYDIGSRSDLYDPRKSSCSARREVERVEGARREPGR